MMEVISPPPTPTSIFVQNSYKQFYSPEWKDNKAKISFACTNMLTIPQWSEMALKVFIPLNLDGVG